MAQLLNPGGWPRTLRQPIHAQLPPGLMLNASKTKKRKKRRISLRKNNPTRFEMMLGAVGIGSGTRPKKIRSSAKRRKSAAAPTVRTLPVGLSHRTLFDGVVTNPLRAASTARQAPCPPGWNWNASQQQCVAPLPGPPGPSPQLPQPPPQPPQPPPQPPKPITPGMSTRTPCPPGWENKGETPWGGKTCWPKPGTPIVIRR